jgi:alkanesulfonate monooxygenase SsuD/methylene tetrahydromethanopterin reductase-like flavin-dependent oxidoreductase (luciferase family)
VEIMKQAWETGTATLDGKHYQVDGARVYPQPIQTGGIPFWIAGGGEKRTLRIAAQYAQYTNFDGSPEGFAHKSRVLEGHCRDLGRDYGQIVRSANYNVVIGRDEAEVEQRLEWIGEHYRKATPSKAEDTLRGFREGPLVGTPEQIVEKLRELEGLGMTYAITYFLEAAYDRSGIELFEREVVPALKG